MISKFQIYYQPTKKQRKRIESFSISYSSFDPDTNTYKKKVVLEKCGEKYKDKIFPEGLDQILPSIEAIDLSTYPKTTVDFDDEVYYIKCGEQHYSTNNCEDIDGLLKQFHFE